MCKFYYIDISDLAEGFTNLKHRSHLQYFLAMAMQSELSSKRQQCRHNLKLGLLWLIMHYNDRFVILRNYTLQSQQNIVGMIVLYCRYQSQNMLPTMFQRAF